MVVGGGDLVNIRSDFFVLDGRWGVECILDRQVHPGDADGAGAERGPRRRPDGHQPLLQRRGNRNRRRSRRGRGDADDATDRRHVAVLGVFFFFCFGVSRCSPSAASGTSRSSAPARRCLATATSNSKRCSSVFLLLLLSLSLLLLLLLLLLMLLFSVVLRSHRWRSGTATHSSSQLEVYSLAPLMGEFVYFRSGYTLKGSDVFTGGRTTRRIPPLFHSVRRWYGTASRDVEISVPLREADQLVIGCIRHGKRARTRPWSLVPSMIMRSRKVLHLQLLLCIHVHIDGNVQ